ncbi:dienelactone hydrolase endo-1,3,1,4-beta-D-glucanase [Phellopilus nigrolimitatus]|nr:dienelactone hydrolase endo-1,3,1,4-beta-D-glucanase [Phellopilus nigrolimitatus]
MSFTFCEHCKAGGELPGEPKGVVLDGAYFAEGADHTKAIVFLTDAFGLALVNSKIMADQLAEKVGCDVWVPDQFEGGQLFELSDLDGLLPQKPGVKLTIGSKLGLVWTILKRLPRLLSNRPAVVEKRIQTFITKLKADKKYEKIGVAGYCFGGSIGIQIAATTLVDSAVISHPGQCSADQIKAIRVPSSWQCAEEDMGFGPQLRVDAEAIFASRKDKPDFIDYEFCDYKGTVHGFAARPNLSIPEAKEGFERSFEATVKWFQKTL